MTLLTNNNKNTNKNYECQTPQKNIISKFKAVHKFIGCASSFKQEAFRAFPNMDSTSRTDAHWQMRPLYFNAFRVSSWRLATYLDASFRFFWKIAQRNTPTDHLNLHSHWHHYMFSRHRLSQIQIQTHKKTSTHTQTQPYRQTQIGRQTQLGRQTDTHTQACNFA